MADNEVLAGNVEFEEKFHEAFRQLYRQIDDAENSSISKEMLQIKLDDMSTAILDKARYDWLVKKGSSSHKNLFAFAAFGENVGETEEAKQDNKEKSMRLRHALTGYLLSIAFSDFAKRAVYMAAAIQRLSESMEQSPLELAKALGVNYPESIWDNEFYNAWATLANFVAQHLDGKYTCATDVFTKTSKLKAKGESADIQI